MDNLLPIESVYERDIDLLLLEELNANQKFLKWITNTLGLPEFTDTNMALRSISDFGLGETDLLIKYNSKNKKVIILIENKLDADFQPEQAFRYKKRAEKYVAENICDKCHCILISPLEYCANQVEFDRYISYESIKDYFTSQDDKRSNFKASIFEIAIEKLRRGYKPTNSETVQKFWHSYWTFKNEYFKDLDMKEPKVVPHKSDWPMLYDKRLSNVIFYHKLSQGNADATFTKISENEKELLLKNIPKWAKYVEHSKTFSIRKPSKKIDRTLPFKGQIDEVRNGLNDLKQLRDWIIKVLGD